MIDYKEFFPDTPRLIEEKVSENGDIFWKQRGYYLGMYVELQFKTNDDDLTRIVQTGDFDSIDWSDRIIASEILA